MNSKEFVIWLKGFTEGVHDFNIIPKQWDYLKQKLAEVSDDKFVETPGMFQVPPQPPYPGTSIGPYGTGTPNHDLVARHPWGGLKVWGGTSMPIPSDPNITGSASISSVWTSNPNNITYTITSGSSCGVGSTYTYPNGTTVSYTAGGANEFDEPKDKTLLHD